jgi:hypothetical protein
MDPCQMCHCPNDGGHLVCSPVPGCNPHGSKKTMLTPPTENNEPLRGVSHLPDNTQTMLHGIPSSSILHGCGAYMLDYYYNEE